MNQGAVELSALLFLSLPALTFLDVRPWLRQGDGLRRSRTAAPYPNIMDPYLESSRGRGPIQ